MVVISPIRLHWIKDDGNDDPKDLCAHSPVSFEINGVKLVRPEDGDWAVSASAVFLLRTLTGDHVKSADQLFPHCGHLICAVGEEEVVMPGCPSGMNFDITHRKGVVVVSRADGTAMMVSEDEWQHAVLDFADSVMTFYGKSRLKQPHYDDDRNGFACMIAELKHRRQQQSKLTGTAQPDYGPGMSATLLDFIEQKLGKYPGVAYTRRPGHLEVTARTPSGFRVTITGDGDGWVVAFEGWHERFEDAEEAMKCFSFGLSAACRLRVLRRGSCDYRWVVQCLENGQWVDDSETGLLLFPFWRRREERILQNNIIDKTSRSSSCVEKNLTSSLPWHLHDKVHRFPESSYGATKVTLILKDGRRIRQVFLSGLDIVKVDRSMIEKPENLTFDPDDVVDAISEV